MKNLNIGGKPVGEGFPVFVIAEAGVNHNGDLGRARKLIDAAVAAGADAVKFQNFKAENIVTRQAEKARYQKRATGSGETQYQMLKKLELSDRAFRQLHEHAERRHIVFLSTPYDEPGVDLLAGMGVAAFKVASAEIVNSRLLRHMAGKGRPIILSTGMATLGEIEESLAVLYAAGLEEVVLLHCITDYPAQVSEMNLRALRTLQCAFGLPVGLSDHTTGLTVPVAAVALGACMIEKHFTLDRRLPGPDHRASLEPRELRAMVAAIREVAQALGDGVKRPTGNEESLKKIMRRSIVAQTEIHKGTAIGESMLTIKRSGGGLPPKCLSAVVGRRANKNIEQDEALTWAKIH